MTNNEVVKTLERLRECTITNGACGDVECYKCPHNTNYEDEAEALKYAINVLFKKEDEDFNNLLKELDELAEYLVKERMPSNAGNVTEAINLLISFKAKDGEKKKEENK